jgi:hypothetical protein
MAFYPYPVIALALKAKGFDPDKSSSVQKLSMSFEHIYEIFRSQIRSFYNADAFKSIFEIIHSGLGLGYNLQTGHVVNPLDGTALTDPEVTFSEPR